MMGRSGALCRFKSVLRVLLGFRRHQQLQAGIVQRNFAQQIAGILEQVAMQAPRLARAGDLAGSDVQAVWLFAV